MAGERSQDGYERNFYPLSFFGRFCPAKRKLKNRSTEHKIARRSVLMPSLGYHSAARCCEHLARPPRAGARTKTKICFF